MKFLALCLSASVLLGAAAYAEEGKLIAEGAKVEVLSEGYLFTEGPAVDKDGNVFFTDQPNDRIVKYNAADGHFSDWLKPAGRSNGTFFDQAGHLLACADGENQLWSIAPDKTVTVLIHDLGGKLLNGPNDLWIRPDGNLYFTDPLYKRDYWNLAGGGSCLDNILWIPAESYTPSDENTIPTGEILPLKGTPMDFNEPTRIGGRIGQLKPKMSGYDHNYILGGGKTLKLAARLSDPKSGRVMEVRTTQPAVQLYTGNHMDHTAVCLETQHYPDAIHHPNFPSIIIRPGESLQETTVYRFLTE